MTTYIIRQSIYSLFIILGVLSVTFVIIRVLPGDPARLALGQRADAQSQAALRKEWKLDQPLPVQYIHYIGNAFKGDLGRSFQSNRQVMDAIVERIPRTAILSISAIFIASIVGTLIGIISAWKPYTIFDNGSMIFALLGISVPVFVLGTILMLIFSSTLQWLPSSGYIVGREGLRMELLILPMLALAARPLSIFARITRSSMLDIMSQDYVRTARAKGVSERVTMLKHVLRNALNPIVTTISAWFAATLAGTFFIELIFNWPGMGKYAFDAVMANDYPVIQGVVAFTAVLFVLVNLIVDILYSVIDPRVRLS